MPKLSFQMTVLSSLFIISMLMLCSVFLFLTSNKAVSKGSLLQLNRFPKYFSGIYTWRLSYINRNIWQTYDGPPLKNDVRFLNAFQANFVASNYQECKSRLPKIALCVFSEPADHMRRNAVRSTWGNESLVLMENITLWFFVGKGRTAEDKMIHNESHTYGDIVIGNFTDTQENKTIKLLFSLYFILTSCPSVEEVYFGSDKTYVNIPHLRRVLTMAKTEDSKGQWRGFLREGMKPQRDKLNPFYISQETFKDDIYPPFCTLDNGFTLSTSLGKEIINLARNETIIQFADIFLGVLVRKAQVKIVFDQSFSSQSFVPNLKICKIRFQMSSFTFLSDLENQWQELVDANKMRKCIVPDIHVVLPKHTDNRPYFDQVLTYLNNNETICAPIDGPHKDIFVVALISSFVKNFEQRQAIRETWASQHLFFGRTVRYVFILSKALENEGTVQEKVNKESTKYGDIVQGNFYESFRNLTLKVVLGLKWTTEFCPHVSYLYKGDEDMFVSWHRLILFLLETSDRTGKEIMSRFFVGSTMYGSPRIDDPRSRYFVNESHYWGKYYIPYCSGGSYVLSTDIVPELYRRSFVTPIISVDDAYQGLLTEQIDVHPIHYRGFKVYYNKKECILQDDDTVTLHGFRSPDSLKHVWVKYQNNEDCP